MMLNIRTVLKISFISFIIFFTLQLDLQHLPDFPFVSLNKLSLQNWISQVEAKNGWKRGVEPRIKELQNKRKELRSNERKIINALKKSMRGILGGGPAIINPGEKSNPGITSIPHGELRGIDQVRRRFIERELKEIQEERELADARLVKYFSRGDILFVKVSSIMPESSDRIQIQVGAYKVGVKKNEFDDWLAGTNKISAFDSVFEGETERKKVIVCQDPLYPGTKAIENHRFVEALRRQYAEQHDILFSNGIDNMEFARNNAANLPDIIKPSDIAAYVPIETFKVKDFKVIDHIKDTLKESGINIISGLRTIPGSNVLFITGHKDQALLNYINKLGREGFLKGKFLSVISCYKAGDEAFNSEKIKKFGLRGIHFNSEEINPQAVEEVLVGITEVLRGNQIKTNWNELYIKGVDRAIENNSHPKLLDEIEKMRRVLLQVSFIRLYGRKTKAKRVA